MIEVIEHRNYGGVIQVPPSKSDAQRAILCAALSNGVSILENVGQSADERAMLECVTELGVQITQTDSETLAISGLKSNPKSKTINVGESGLAARLLIAVSSIFNEKITITGKGSLLQRNMLFFDQELPKFKVTVDSTGHKLPISVQGPIHGTKTSVDGSQSSQYLSGLLMALPKASETSEIEIYDLKSKPYLQMTLRTLKAFGIEIKDLGNDRYVIPGRQEYQAANYRIQGDWSAASCWLTAAALGASIVVSGLQLDSLQADKRMLTALLNAGCVVEQKSDGITVNGQKRKPFEFDATHCPDLFPALAVLAAFTKGESRIKGISRLINKESNRALVLQKEFAKLNVTILLEEDTMIIQGREKIEGGRVESNNDHRIAMCFAIVGMFSITPVTIHGSEAVSKSYPAFWAEFRKLSS